MLASDLEAVVERLCGFPCNFVEVTQTLTHRGTTVVSGNIYPEEGTRKTFSLEVSLDIFEED